MEKHKPLTEAAIQKSLVVWCKTQNILPIHVPNEAIRVNYGENLQGKDFHFWAMGVLSGCPDLVLLKNSQILFLELKTQKGKLSESQKKAHEKIASHGFDVQTAFGLEEAKQIITTHFKLQTNENNIILVS